MDLGQDFLYLTKFQGYLAIQFALENLLNLHLDFLIQSHICQSISNIHDWD